MSLGIFDVLITEEFDQAIIFRSGDHRPPGPGAGWFIKTILVRPFTNIFRKLFRTVNVERFNRFEAGAVIDPAAMQEAGLLKKGSHDVKVLGNGELSVALTVRSHKFTASAIKKIEAAGGTAERLGA